MVDEDDHESGVPATVLASSRAAREAQGLCRLVLVSQHTSTCVLELDGDATADVAILHSGNRFAILADRNDVCEEPEPSVVRATPNGAS